MILGALSVFLRRGSVPIGSDELATLDFEAARARNHLLGRALRRARARLKSVAQFGWAFVFAYLFGWTPAGVLGFLVYSAVLTAAVDGIRYGLAKRWVHYSHARNYRAEGILATGVAVEQGRTRRPAAALRPRPRVVIAVAGVATLVVLPIVAIVMSRLGWVVWREVLANLLMPFFMLMIGIWRIVGAVRESLSAREQPVGSQDLMLDSDDAFDIYAGVLLFAPLALLFPSSGPLLIAICVYLARVGYRAYDWWSLRESLPLLSAYAERRMSAQPAAEGGRAAALAAAYGDDPGNSGAANDGR